MEIIEVVKQLGFPIFVSLYLLIKKDKNIESLSILIEDNIQATKELRKTLTEISNNLTTCLTPRNQKEGA